MHQDVLENKAAVFSVDDPYAPKSILSEGPLMKISEYATDVRSYVIWVLLGCLFLSAESMRASTLRCKFIDEQGKVLRNVETRLTLVGMEEHHFQKSNKSGEVVFPDLKQGSYELMAHLKGFVPVKREVGMTGDQTVDQVLMTEKAFDQTR